MTSWLEGLASGQPGGQSDTSDTARMALARSKEDNRDMLKARTLWSAGLLALFSLSILLSACSELPTTTTSIRRGGSIVEVIAQEPDSLLPYAASLTFSNLVMNSIWAPLWYSDNQIPFQYHPGLAKEVPALSNGGIGADAKSYTIHLKAGLKWSNGSPLTASDVAFTINLFANPDYGANSFPTAEGITATATDTTTVHISLTTPDATLVGLLSNPPAGPLPKMLFGSMKASDIVKSTENNTPSVSSGPFTVSDRKLGDSITVKNNPNFYLGPTKPYLDQITFKLIADTTTQLTAAEAGQFDAAWFLSVNQLDTYKGLTNYETGYDKLGTTYEAAYLNLDPKKSPFLADKNVRLALAQAWDPRSVIHSIWKDTATYTCDDNPGNPAHSPELIGPTGCYTVDQANAASRLDQAGWTMGSDGYRHKGGQTLELRYYTSSTRKYRDDTALIARDTWRKIGAKIDIVSKGHVLFANDKGGMRCSGYYDIVELARNSSLDPDDHANWASDQICPQGSNDSFYSNPQVDQLYKDETSNPNFLTRIQDLKQIQKAVIDDVAVIWLYAFPNIYTHKKTLKNYAPSAFTQDTWNCWDWHE